MIRWIAVTSVLVTVVAACGALNGGQPSPPVDQPAGVLSPTSETRAALARLPVAPATGMAGYTRDRFGQPWKDTDHNGCDQRSDVLLRDAGSAARDEKRPCKVVAITLLDPYTGRRIDKVSDIQIDHVVSLGAAWRSGAAGWSDEQRELFATDESNLLAVDGKTNQAKGDDTPEGFRKLIRREAWCLVAKVYIATSGTYHLSVTSATRDALSSMVDTCGT
jgi:hypothetical protein